jgi:uncharacterized protein (TIGR02448 family)
MDALAMLRPFMRPIMGLALLTCVPLAAQAGSFAGTTGGASSAGSSASSGSTSGDDKVVLRARDDAASFVASDGRIRSARLEAALRHLRERDAAARAASDLQLAVAILAR